MLLGIVFPEGLAENSFPELLNKYKVGDVIDGVISGVADFGAFIRFIDNPEIEGLIHVSEIDYRIIDNPKEILKIGEAVKAQIVDIKEGRVFLSLKSLKHNPWEDATEKYKVHDLVDGIVYKFNFIVTFPPLPS